MGHGQNTKQRLLEAARGLFAERGYHNTTVRDIALRSKTNLASINYYFRSKDDLYREVIHQAFQTSVSNSASVARDMPSADIAPEERLRQFVRRLIPSSPEEAGDDVHRRLMAWEMLAPTGAVETVDEWEIRAHLDDAQAVVQPFLKAGASGHHAVTSALWLIGQCLIFRKLALKPDYHASPIAHMSGDGEKLIDFVVTHAISGLSL